MPFQVDVVVFATGYDYSFPFLPSDLQAKCGYRLHLYKHMFPPALTRPTLAVVGFIHGLGAINPLAEMQGRLATRVFKGKVQHGGRPCVNVTSNLSHNANQFSLLPEALISGTVFTRTSFERLVHFTSHLFFKGNPSVHTYSNIN